MAFLKLRSTAEHTAASVPDIRQVAIETAFQVLHGHNPKRKAGSGEAFWQFREYSEGDMPREIDWRQSAKTDRVYIRQKELHTAQSCLFWLKQNADMDFCSRANLPGKRLAASVLALSLALIHSRSGETVGYAGRQRPGHSEKTIGHFEQLLHEMRPDALPRSLKVPRNATFYAFSDFLEEPGEIEAALAPLAERTRNGWLVQVLDPAELDLPYDGRILFEDMHGKNQTVISNASDIKNEYHQRMLKHIEILQKLCGRWGWTYILHRTDMSYKFTAMKIWLEGGS